MTKVVKKKEEKKKNVFVFLFQFFQTRLFWSALGRPCQVRVNKRVWYRKHLIPKHAFIFFILPRFCLTFKWVSKSLDKNIIPTLMVTSKSNNIESIQQTHPHSQENDVTMAHLWHMADIKITFEEQLSFRLMLVAFLLQTKSLESKLFLSKRFPMQSATFLIIGKQK